MPTPHGLSIVIPVYNEVESLELLHSQLSQALQGLSLPADVLYVDDGSQDGSFEVIARLAQLDRRVRGVQLRRHYGKSAALSVGFARACGDILITLDSDLQDDPAEIPRLLAALDAGCDLVCGWRALRRDSWSKRWTSWMFNALVRRLTGLPLHDCNSGMKAFRRPLVEGLQLYGEQHRLLAFQAARLGYDVAEIAVQHHPRRFGKSKYGIGRGLSGLFDLFTAVLLAHYTTRPMHIFGLPGVVCFIAGAVICAWLAWERLFLSRYLSNRPLLVLGVLLVLVGLQFFSLGLFGEMLTAAHADRLRYEIRRQVGEE